MEELTPVITDLASKLGVASERIYQALLLQRWVDIIIWCICLLLTPVCVYLTLRWYKKSDDCDVSSFTAYMTACVIAGICALCLVVFVMSYLSQTLTALINPDAYVVLKSMSLMP